jgi:hypothetical protein
MTKVVNAQPPKFEWRVYRNDTSNLTIAALNDDGTQFDLTGYSLEGMVREYPNSETALQTLEVSAQENIITVALDTSALPSICYFDIQSTYDGNVKTLLYGTIFVEEDITWA